LRAAQLASYLSHQGRIRKAAGRNHPNPREEFEFNNGGYIPRLSYLSQSKSCCLQETTGEGRRRRRRSEQIGKKLLQMGEESVLA
jgi:hypothetical protein